MDSDQLKLRVHFRAKSGRPFLQLIEDTGLSLKDVANEAVSYYEAALKAECQEARVLALVSRDYKEYKELDLNNDPAYQIEDLELDVDHSSVRAISDKFGIAAKDVMSNALFLYDQIADADLKSHMIGLLDLPGRRFREIVKDKLAP